MFLRRSLVSILLMTAACSGSTGSSGSSGATTTTSGATTSGASSGNSTASGSTTSSTATTGTSGASTGSSTGSVSSSSGSTGGTPITGDAVATYVPLDGGYVEGDAGWINRNNDLSQLSIAGMVVLADAGYQSLDGVGASDGTFTIDGVPQGASYLVFLNDYTGVLTSARVLDLGYVVGGRPDDEQLAYGQGLSVAVNVTGIQPIDVSQELVEAIAPNDAFYNFDFQYPFAPADGGLASALVGSADWSTLNEYSNPVGVDPTHGDALYISQLVTVDAGDNGALSLRSLVGFADLTGASIGASGTNTLSGALAPVVGATPFSAILPREMPGASDLPTGSGPWYGGMNLSAFPGDVAFGQYSWSADLLYVYNTDFSSSSPWTAAANYANPYPPSWPVVATASLVSYLKLTVDSRTGGALYVRPQYQYVDLLSSFPSTLTPAISPPRDVLVNGRPSNVAQTGIGKTPVITWYAPSLGTATYYSVAVHQVDYDATAQRVSDYQVGSFIVPAPTTQLTLPDGILDNSGATSSSRFYLVVLADNNVGFSSSAPFRSVLPEESASTVTNLLAP
ncbi:MAG: hypothetical protein JST54_22320 [Deltaproteobacteria bacterium]|nr:hypothetical protein [Deltaproteobacteria bacterium]